MSESSVAEGLKTVKSEPDIIWINTPVGMFCFRWDVATQDWKEEDCAGIRVPQGTS